MSGSVARRQRRLITRMAVKQKAKEREAYLRRVAKVGGEIRPSGSVIVRNEDVINTVEGHLVGKPTEKEKRAGLRGS